MIFKYYQELHQNTASPSGGSGFGDIIKNPEPASLVSVSGLAIFSNLCRMSKEAWCCLNGRQYGKVRSEVHIRGRIARRWGSRYPSRVKC